MNRVEEFKLIRGYKKKCVSIILFFLVLTVAGVLVSDYCINSIVKNEKKVEILQWESGKDTTIKLSVLNSEIVVQYGGVLKDFQYLKGKVFEWAKMLLPNK